MGLLLGVFIRQTVRSMQVDFAVAVNAVHLFDPIATALAELTHGEIKGHTTR